MRGMWKKLRKKLMVISVFLLLTAVIGILPAKTAQAAAPKIQKNIQFRLYKANKRDLIIPIKNASGGKITKLNNSKPSIAKVSVYQKNSLLVDIRSAGSTKVSFSYKGKKLSTKITIKKWENPCKEFTIGSKNYAKYFEKSERYSLNKQSKTINAKVKITPKKGWKLLKIEAQAADTIRSKKVKNHSKVKFSIDMTGTAIYAHFKNNKTGERETVALWRSSTPWASENGYREWIDQRRRTHSVW